MNARELAEAVMSADFPVFAVDQFGVTQSMVMSAWVREKDGALILDIEVETD